MEGVVLIGIQATGKTTFYRERLFSTHMRISLDLLRTRHRERRLFSACLETSTKVVIDNTNPSREDRARYIPLFKAHRYTVIGYYFESSLEEALVRNAGRTGRERIPEAGVRSALRRLEPPAYDEGFDRLYRVRIENGAFTVQELPRNG